MKMYPAVLFFVAALAACTRPCDRLAEIACERHGRGSEVCSAIERRAGSAYLDDQRYCAEAVKILAGAAVGGKPEGEGGSDDRTGARE